MKRFYDILLSGEDWKSWKVMSHSYEGFEISLTSDLMTKVTGKFEYILALDYKNPFH